MSTLLKKISVTFLSFLVLFFSIAPNFAVARAADSTWYNQDFKTWFTKVGDTSNPNEIFGERYTAAQVQWVIYGIFAFFINQVTPPGSAAACMSGDIISCTQNIKDFLSSLALEPSSNSSLVQLIFADRPISGVTYIRNTVQNFNPVPVVHAQTGVGFSALSSVQDMWSGFRDVAYGLFVLVAVIFAFMIMFRVKINPQTVITVQSAIPKIVISLVLVTFSYAIAGLLIDFMYVVIGLVSLVMAPLIPTNVLNSTPQDAQGVFTLLTVGAKGGGIFSLLITYLSPIILLSMVLLVAGALITIGSLGVGSVFMGVFLIIFVVVLIVALWMTVKITFALFKSLANVILLTIFAPLHITFGVLIPNLGFGQWVKSFISQLSVFVVTGVLWLLAWIFMLQAWSNISFSGGPVSSWPPLLGFGGQPLILLGASFVLFTLIPKATELVQSFISGKPFAYGSAIGEVWGPFGKYGSAGARLGTDYGLSRYAAHLEAEGRHERGLTGLIYGLINTRQHRSNNPLTNRNPEGGPKGPGEK